VSYFFDLVFILFDCFRPPRNPTMKLPNNTVVVQQQSNLGYVYSNKHTFNLLSILAYPI
jgi:hypothetical protein